MNAELLNVLPSGQPFDDPELGYIYNGIEYASVPNRPPLAVDWILVSLIDTTATPDTLVARSASILRTNGEALGVFYDIPQDLYSVMVDHRNHLAIASDTLVDFTGGYAEHDFTTGHAYGVNPQKTIVSGQDTVYAMRAGDGNVDGQITGADRMLWYEQTTTSAWGYIESDYNLDRQSTATDYNYWLANRVQVSTAPGLVSTALYNALDNAPWTDQSPVAAPKTATVTSHRLRYRVTGNAQNEPLGFAWAPLEVRTNSASIDTLASATFDVYFNKDQMYYNTPQQYQDLLDAGYKLDIRESVNEHGPFIRVDIFTEQPDTTRYLLDNSWDKLLRIGFKEEDGTITDHGVAANRGTTDLGLLSNGTLIEPDSVAIHYQDAFQY